MRGILTPGINSSGQIGLNHLNPATALRRKRLLNKMLSYYPATLLKIAVNFE
jgi:hypothetical protein